MKKILFALLITLPLTASAQTVSGDDTSRYLAGAVTLNEAGYVTFQADYRATGKTQAELMKSLSEYIEQSIVNGPDHLDRSRITETDPATGLIAANIEEYLYFKRKAWTMDRVRFTYQLIYRVSDGGFSVEMRNLRYQYDDEAKPEVLRAEQWITDAEALNKEGTRLTRIGGKFRRFTIDRKDAIFQGSAAATDASLAKTQ